MTAVVTFHPMTTAPDQPERRPRARLRRLAIDLRPLRASRDFRLIWTGLLVTSTGSQFTLIAVFVQVKELTGSEVAVGATGLAYLLGLVVGSLAGGAILDAWDRRRLLMFAQVGLAGGSAILLGGALAGEPPLWLIYTGLAVLAASSSLDGPTRSAITARIIDPAQLPAAQALNQVVWNTAALLGPLLAGLVIAWAGGVTVAYAVDLASIGCMFVAASLLRPMPPMREDHADTGLRAIREGFNFARKHRLIMSTFLIDLIAMVFGLPRVLFPFLIVDQFHGSAKAIGLLFAALAIGALFGALTSGWTGRIRRQGLAVIVSVAAWGVAIAAFGLSTWLWLGLAMLALAGWADVISAIFRTTILQMTAPDRLRGRLFGIHILVVTGGPRLGDVEAGVVARLASPTFSVVSGGIACVIGAGLVALAYPELRRARATDVA
jgi:MFS family permease